MKQPRWLPLKHGVCAYIAVSLASSTELLVVLLVPPGAGRSVFPMLPRGLWGSSGFLGRTQGWEQD